MNQVKGLLFDLDGTLVDTFEANYRAYKLAIEKIGRRMTKKMYFSVYGVRVDDFLKKFYDDITVSEIESVKKYKAEAYPSYLHLTKPNRQLIDFVKTLRPQHVTVLVTSAQKINAVAVLKSASIEDMFDYVVTGNDVNNAKPHPEAYQLALKKSGLNANEVLAFEDSIAGKDSAMAAGIKVLEINMSRGQSA